MRRVFIITFFLILAAFGLVLGVARASVQDEIDARNRQIEEIQKQIDEYQRQINENSAKARTLAVEIDRLNAQINKVQLEIKGLSIAIDQTNLEIGDTQNEIQIALDKLKLYKEALARYIRILYQLDQENLTQVLLRNSKLSDFFNNLKNLEDIQNNLRATIINIKELKTDLEEKELDLRDKKAELEQLKYLQELEKRSFDSVKQERTVLLRQTQGQEKQFQALVAQSKRDIEAIRSQITYLIQQGVTVEEAIKYGELAALRVGIRPAFLIAILEVESGLGRNVGSGNWRDDMYECYLRLADIFPQKRTHYLNRAETEKNAFLVVVGKLGLNPDTVKVSAEPYYGCGGAMGPAQFIPSTWLAYEEEVARLTGHNPPNPWNIEDAFMASAVKLARGGATAQTRTAEIAAAKAYISGNSRCSSNICNYYANAVINKAAVIEQNL